MKKRLGISLIFCCALIFLLALPAFAAPRVLLDGNPLTFDVSPIIEQGRVLVPMRAIFESLGADVAWDGKTKTVTAVKGSTTVKLTIGVRTAYKNGAPVTLDVPAKILNGRTLVPLRFVSEALGASVDWDGKTKTVTIVSVSGGKVVQIERLPTGSFLVRKLSRGSGELTVENGTDLDAVVILSSPKEPKKSFNGCVHSIEGFLYH